MSETLIFQLQAQLGAFGGITTGVNRYTELRPRRSTVLGLIAAALGIDRDNDQAHLDLQANLRLAFRKISKEDFVLTDFHTIQSPKGEPDPRIYASRRDLLQLELNCLPTYREYICDFYWQIGIQTTSSEQQKLLSLISDRLREPVFTLFAGRKSCPLCLPPNPKIYDSGFAAAFRESQKELLNPSSLEPFDETELSNEVYWEGLLEEPGITFVKTIRPRDSILSRSQWLFLESDLHFGELQPQ